MEDVSLARGPSALPCELMLIVLLLLICTNMNTKTTTESNYTNTNSIPADTVSHNWSSVAC